MFHIWLGYFIIHDTCSQLIEFFTIELSSIWTLRQLEFELDWFAFEPKQSLRGAQKEPKRSPKGAQEDPRRTTTEAQQVLRMLHRYIQNFASWGGNKCYILILHNANRLVVSIRNSNKMNPCVMLKLLRQHKLEEHAPGVIGAWVGPFLELGRILAWCFYPWQRSRVLSWAGSWIGRPHLVVLCQALS